MDQEHWDLDRGDLTLRGDVVEPGSDLPLHVAKDRRCHHGWNATLFELEALVRIGHSPREALAAATSNFGTTFANWGDVGQVRPGYRADLLVLDRDPRHAVENLESIQTLILAGRVLDRQALLTGTGRDGEIIDRR